MSWLDAVAALGLEELVPMADQIFAELRFGVNNILGKQIVPLRQEEFAKDLRSRLDATDLDEWLEQHGLCPFEDTIAEVSSWHYCSDKYRKQQRCEQIARSNFDTAVNPTLRFGQEVQEMLFAVTTNAKHDVSGLNRGPVRAALVFDRYRDREPSGGPPGQGAPAQARAVGEE